MLQTEIKTECISRYFHYTLKCISFAHQVLLFGLVTLLPVPYSCVVLSLIFMARCGHVGYVRELFISACLAVAIGYQNLAYPSETFLLLLSDYFLKLARLMFP